MNWYKCNVVGCAFSALQGDSAACIRHHKEAHPTLSMDCIFDEGGGKYRNTGDGFSCRDCGSEIQAATVARPIWDGPFSCSGSGRCEYEQRPYCPKCEAKPNFHGSPIQV